MFLLADRDQPEQMSKQWRDAQSDLGLHYLHMSEDIFA